MTKRLVRNRLYVLLSVLVICILAGLSPAALAGEEKCCKVSWEMQSASGTVPFMVNTCCPPPLGEYCTVYVTSESWIKFVPQVSAPIYDCNEFNTIPIGSCLRTIYICTGPYQIDASGCYLCPCIGVPIPEGDITLGMLLYLLDTAGPIQSNQAYCCGQAGG